MLEVILRNDDLPLPAQLAADKWRDTAVAVIASPNQQAVAMVMPAKDPLRQTISFVQGGVEDLESVRTAARREVREEIVSLARPQQTDEYRVQWSDGMYLGSFCNHFARSGVPKRLHFFVLPALIWKLQPDLTECAAAFWVHHPDDFKAMLESTRLENEEKYNAMCAAVFAAQNHGYLL